MFIQAVGKSFCSENRIKINKCRHLPEASSSQHPKEERRKSERLIFHFSDTCASVNPTPLQSVSIFILLLFNVLTLTYFTLGRNPQRALCPTYQALKKFPKGKGSSTFLVRVFSVKHHLIQHFHKLHLKFNSPKCALRTTFLRILCKKVHKRSTNWKPASAPRFTTVYMREFTIFARAPRGKILECDILHPQIDTWTHKFWPPMLPII
ncbi:hypothetical protein KQX54_009695 [Cotesia glomerata]|uniref:Uncharacterized protein n=1 Tax=Cotesia glomerata TaxID=32391 RepID=A0AAV7J4E5_COTGL|nr:hypothetical protein KQX54_009695 [Cotesia glomerata]